MKAYLRRATVGALATAVTMVGLMIGTAGSAAAFDSGGTELVKGDTMWGWDNQWLYGYSRDWNYQLVMQSDGNLVEYRTDLVGGSKSVCWSTDTWRYNTNAHATFQSDGNFVVYRDSDNYVMWASGTGGGSFVNINSAGVIWVGNRAIPNSGRC